MAKRNRLRDDWGSVSYDPKKKVGRIRYWSATNDGYKRVSETVRGTRKDVERRRAELRLKHDEDAPCPTVGQLWHTYYHPWRKRRVEEGRLGVKTVSQDESAWRCHIAPRWENVRADKVLPALVQGWLEAGMTTNQASDGLRVLHGILKHATTRGLINHDPLAGIEFDLPTAHLEHDRQIWSIDELGAAWRAVRGLWWEPAFLLMAFGSARPGESLGPMADEVERMDVDGLCVAVVPIVRQVANSGRVSDKLKNRWSERPLVLPGVIGERVLEIASEHPGDWLTSDGSGYHTTQDRLRTSLSRTFSEAGLPVHPPRNLRASWETFTRWELKVPDDRIEKMMGHVGSGSRVTAAHYDRPTAELFARTIAEAYRETPYAEGWFDK